MSVLMICMGVALWRDLSVEHEWIVRRERRLLRSRLVEDTVAAVAEQMDDSVRSTGRVEPISLPEPLWAWPIRKQGKPFPPLMLPKIIGKDSKDAGDGEPDDKGAQ